MNLDYLMNVYLKRVSHFGILYGSRYFVESRFGNPSNENPFQVENLCRFRLTKNTVDCKFEQFYFSVINRKTVP